MQHPDDLTPAQEFRILIDERPAQAEAILAQGAEALHLLNSVSNAIHALLMDEAMHQRAITIGLLGRKDTLPVVAMKYGALLDRHTDMAQTLGALSVQLRATLERISAFCLHCNEPHLAAECQTDEP